MEENSSVEVSEESRRGSKVSLDIIHPFSRVLDSYMVPVVFDKADQSHQTEADETEGSEFCAIIIGGFSQSAPVSKAETEVY